MARTSVEQRKAERRRTRPRATVVVRRALERGTRRVEKLHRSAASAPLDALVRIPRLKAPVGRVRRLQERAITARYALVRGVNRELVRLLAGPPAQRRAKPGKRQSVRQSRPAARTVELPRPAAVAS